MKFIEWDKIQAKYSYLIRKNILDFSNRAKSAHAGSSLSCVEILSTLFEVKYSRILPIQKIILSKGHAAMALYSTALHFKLLDPIHLEKYLENGTQLWGHSSRSPSFPFIDWSTGSLGHGLAVSVGYGYAGKNIKKENKQLYTCLLSDGECDEGSTWEAILFAGHHELHNLVAVVDYNKIQSFGRVADVLNLEPFGKKFESFNWKVIEVNGHNMGEIFHALEQAYQSQNKPTCIVAHTIKGKGVPSIENTISCHYKPITNEQIKEFEENEKHIC